MSVKIPQVKPYKGSVSNMCLSRVDKIYKGTSRRIETRYKVFKRYKESKLLWPAYRKLYNGLPEGVWLNEKTYRLRRVGSLINIGEAYGEASYPLGWHVYKYEEDARSLAKWLRYNLHWSVGHNETCILRRVQCRGLLAVGEENGQPVEVFQYIKIERGNLTIGEDIYQGGVLRFKLFRS